MILQYMKPKVISYDDQYIPKNREELCYEYWKSLFKFIFKGTKYDTTR